MFEDLYVSEEMVRSNFGHRSIDSRKGQNGSVGVIGGSRLYHGAPFLSASAALRSGVDLAYLCVPQKNVDAVRALSPDIIVIPRPDTKLTVGSVNKLLKWLPKVDSAVVGPGLGFQVKKGIVFLLRELFSREVRLVIDADGLRRDILDEVKGKECVITPHSGEFMRLIDGQIGDSFENKVKKVKEAAKELEITILLKGRTDIISDGEKIALNQTGSPAMTAGGTGDILSGIVAGLLARGLDTYNSAYCGAYFNGLSGMKSAERMGMHIVASDLLQDIPQVMRNFD
jgi:NAD(P)H-hydrate epimerase